MKFSFGCGFGACVYRFDLVFASFVWGGVVVRKLFFVFLVVFFYNLVCKVFFIEGFVCNIGIRVSIDGRY